MFADKLKKSVLQAAIQGKLTEQLSTDGDAKDLLKKIREEKSKLIAEGKIKSEKSLPPITAEEIPFDIRNLTTYYLHEVLAPSLSFRSFFNASLLGALPIVTHFPLDFFITCPTK